MMMSAPNKEFKNIKSSSMSKVAKSFKTLLLAGTVTVMTCAVPSKFMPLGASTAAAQNIIKVQKRASGTENVVLGLDKSLVLELPEDAQDILVANPDVADAVTRTARRIYLFGKEVGQTNIFVFDRNGNQMVSLQLQVERDVAGLDRYLERFIAGSNIKTEIINDNIVLTGTVQTPQDSAKAAKLAEIFVKGGDATNNGAESFLALFSRGDSQIVNLLEIAGGDQVTLKVTVAEIQRSVMKQLGINLLSSGSSSGVTYSGISDTIAGALGKPLSNSGVSLGGAIGGVNINAYFKAMEEAGVMKTLSAPTLTAISGEPAKFFAGGTYNIISGQTVDDETQGITYTFDKIDYGVGLEFTPVVLSPGRISLRIKTEVSEPTTDGSVPLSGGVNRLATNVLSLRRREAETTVELPSGGSMMIAGLIRDDVRQVVSGFPGLSKLPVIGSLFRSRDFIRSESELVIMVTPYLVRAVAASELALPTDNFAPASDSVGNLLGRLNRIYGSTDKTMPTGRYHGAVGFIYK
jgi:pilus assembly protein CpaC